MGFRDYRSFHSKAHKTEVYKASVAVLIAEAGWIF